MPRRKPVSDKVSRSRKALAARAPLREIALQARRPRPTVRDSVRISAEQSSATKVLQRRPIPPAILEAWVAKATPCRTRVIDMVEVLQRSPRCAQLEVMQAIVLPALTGHAIDNPYRPASGAILCSCHRAELHNVDRSLANCQGTGALITNPRSTSPLNPSDS